jgi:hypothetical protein
MGLLKYWVIELCFSNYSIIPPLQRYRSMLDVQIP